ncbi:HAD family hydrolase [Geodermatophilus sp. SYSU D00697]
MLADQEATVVDVWGVSATVGSEEPSPELFAWWPERAGCAPEEGVHVGNRLDNDVRPAAALGLDTVWVLRGEAPDEPTPEQLAEADLAVADVTGLAEVPLPLTAPRR